MTIPTNCCQCGKEIDAEMAYSDENGHYCQDCAGEVLYLGVSA